MDYIGLLKRSFQITLRYRALWIFGFFLALCSGGGSGSGGNYSGNFGNGGSDNPFAGVDPSVFITIGIVILCLVLIVIVVGVVVNSVTRGSLIGMVDQIEQTGTTTVKDGWRIGFSRHAVNIFLVNLILGLPITVLAILFLALALSPLIILIFNSDPTDQIIAGVILLTIGLFLLWALFLFLISVLVLPVREFSWRYVVLRQRGPIAALQESFGLVVSHVKSVAILLLLLAGVWILWAVGSLFVAIIILLIAGIIGAIPGLLIYLIVQDVLPAIIVGGIVMLAVAVIPLTFITGLYLILRSGIWTLAYGELMALNTPKALIPAKSIDPRGVSPEEAEDDSSKPELGRCQAITKGGTQCKNNALPGSQFCFRHHEEPG